MNGLRICNDSGTSGTKQKYKNNEIGNGALHLHWQRWAIILLSHTQGSEELRRSTIDISEDPVLLFQARRQWH